MTPNIQQWVLNIQRQVTDTLMIEAGYMGSMGHYLQKMHGWNQPLLRSGPGDNTTENQRRPWGGEEYGTIQIVSSLGNSNYHALGVKVLQRSNNGLTYLLGYTWAKSIDDSSAIRTNGGDNLFPIELLRLEQRARPVAVPYGSPPDGVHLYDLPLRFDNKSARSSGGRLAGWRDLHLLDRHSPWPRRLPGNYNFGGSGGADANGSQPERKDRGRQKPSGARVPTVCKTPSTAAERSRRICRPGLPLPLRQLEPQLLDRTGLPQHGLLRDEELQDQRDRWEWSSVRVFNAPTTRTGIRRARA